MPSAIFMIIIKAIHMFIHSFYDKIIIIMLHLMLGI